MTKKQFVSAMAGLEMSILNKANEKNLIHTSDIHSMIIECMQSRYLDANIENKLIEKINMNEKMNLFVNSI